MYRAPPGESLTHNVSLPKLVPKLEYIKAPFLSPPQQAFSDGRFFIIMKILLIYPYCLEARIQEEEVSAPPIGIYYVAALLKENQYDVEILNWHAIDQTPYRIREILTEKQPEIIGFSILHANRWGAIDIARIAKKINPNVQVVFGGIGATFLWEYFLTHFSMVDYVVLGEGEHSFLGLVKCLEKPCAESLEAIPGLAFRKDQTVFRTRPAEYLQDLDALPNPARYFRYQHVVSSRGCPGKCTFCGSPRFWGNKVRFHSPEYFVDQLTMLHKKGITFFYFSDDTFTLKKERVIRICRRIIEKGLNISWAAISRVNILSGEILYWMRRAGCIQISFGVESGSEKIRNQILNKNIRTNQIKEAFALTTQYGILPRAYFIYGAPGENWDTIQETAALIRDIKPLSIIFYILDIFPGTGLYQDFLLKTGNCDDVWLERIEDILYFETDSELNQEMVLAFGEKLRTEFHQNLPEFAESIQLLESEDLAEAHADFLSRLGMTFSHGDYAKLDSVPKKEQTAESLFKRALAYFPVHRAFLGLALLEQKNSHTDESIRVLLQGLEYYPHSEHLNLCLGINFMNKGLYEKALACFRRFPDAENAAYYISRCREAIGAYSR